MRIVTWPISQALMQETNAHYRARIASLLQSRTVIDIVREVTFDAVAPTITVEDVDRLISFLNTRILGRKFRGTCLEVGGGCGFFSALLARIPDVEEVYSVEVSEQLVTQLMPKVTHEIAAGSASKIIGCVGDFDHLDVHDASVDCIFDFFSLHHSPDITRTFRELRRVLKPGGLVVCLDKARSNSLTTVELDALLDREYAVDAKANMGIPAHIHHTRRMNGEKEYRLDDWRDAFIAAGFSQVEHFHLAKIVGSNVSMLVKSFISSFSPRVQARMTNIIPYSGNKNNLEIRNRIYTNLVNPFPKEISLIVARI